MVMNLERFEKFEKQSNNNFPDKDTTKFENMHSLSLIHEIYFRKTSHYYLREGKTV